MSLPRPPADLAAQVRWLVDRAAIGDVLVEFARALDDRDWAAYAGLYAPDGSMTLPGGQVIPAGDGMAEGVAASLSGYAGGTHHLSANHAIHLDGDSATTRSYVLAAHVLDTPSRHADGAGWYDCRLRRSDDGWRLESVVLSIRYVSGEPVTH